MLNFFKRSASSGRTRGIEFIVVGLGNPGLEYEKTRHNAGFMVLDRIFEKNRVINGFNWRMRHKSKVAKADVMGHQVILAKPQTYMNLSGDAVLELVEFYKVQPERLIVVLDDIYLDVGRIRIRRRGSAGGHNGLRDVILKTSCDNFSRIKVGVGNKPDGWNLANWVTSRFNESEKKPLNAALEAACEAVTLMLCGRTDEAMNKFSS